MTSNKNSFKQNELQLWLHVRKSLCMAYRRSEMKFKRAAMSASFHRWLSPCEPLGGPLGGVDGGVVDPPAPKLGGT